MIVPQKCTLYALKETLKQFFIWLICPVKTYCARISSYAFRVTLYFAKKLIQCYAIVSIVEIDKVLKIDKTPNCK